jgi:hypothetical protein
MAGRSRNQTLYLALAVSVTLTILVTGCAATEAPPWVPRPRGIKVIARIPIPGPDPVPEGCTVVAEAILFGTSLNWADARTAFGSALVEEGWQSTGLAHEMTMYARRGDQGVLRLSRTLGNLAPFFVGKVDFDKARAKYATLFSVEVRRYLPDFTACGVGSP